MTSRRLNRDMENDDVAMGANGKKKPAVLGEFEKHEGWH